MSITQAVRCPECLREVEQEELDIFGGFCENCREPLDESEQIDLDNEATDGQKLRKGV